MSESEGSTIPNTPESFPEDVTNRDTADVFAWLRPHSKTACAAFDASLNFVIKSPKKYENNRRLFNVQERGERASSVYTEDDVTATSGSPQWSGAFKLSLKSLPQDPARGWVIGTNRAQVAMQVDFLLAPPTKAWRNSSGIASNHARLFIHPESCRMMLEARHTVTVTKNGARVLSRSISCVIEHGELIEIGSCSYIFEYTELYYSSAFEKDISQFMGKYVTPGWSMNKLLSPGSVGDPQKLGNYYCSPTAFAQGTFGKISAGWTRDGKAVSIKVFKKPDYSAIIEHQRMMKYIGSHPNILQLLDSVTRFHGEVPEAHCIYSPLATSTITRITGDFEVEFPAKAMLLVDYLSGLAFLHDKGVMHRDISPNNLAVTSFNKPRGIIIDLDSATSHTRSTDDLQGTVPFLAPEIIALKAKTMQLPYDKGVDVWALGLCMFMLYSDHAFRWAYFVSRHGSKTLSVNQECHAEFHKRIDRSMNSLRDVPSATFLELIKDMTVWDAVNRISAAEALQKAKGILLDRTGVIYLRSSHKRPFEVLTTGLE